MKKHHPFCIKNKMKIIQKRIVKPEGYLSGIQRGHRFYIGLLDVQRFSVRLQQLGFSAQLNVGERLLPGVIGKVTGYNANGSFIRRKDLGKETCYRDAEMKDWHGNYHLVTIAYERYRRQPLPALGTEMTINTGADGSRVVLSSALTLTDNNLNIIKHIINLYLECFGECDLLLENLIPAFNVPVRRLNWDVLPAGNYPWQRLENQVRNVVNAVNDQRKNIVLSRLQIIANHNPTFAAIGRAGFRGYLVFGFADFEIYILESIYTGNATYVLNQNWEQISNYSKEEILNQNLHMARFIHNDTWANSINHLLTRAAA